MWHDHPFSQRNRTTEKTGGGVGGERELGGGGGWTKYEKQVGGVGNIWGSS